MNISDLRKNNWVRTEHGIVKVAYVIWNDVYIYGKDGRVNHAKDVEMKIKLPILFNTDSTSTLEKADIDFDLRLCEIKEITFYQINAVIEYFENEIEYSQIYSNGMSFYSTFTAKEVEYLIEKQLNYKFEVN